MVYGGPKHALIEAIEAETELDAGRQLSHGDHPVSKYNTRHSPMNTLSSQCHYLSNRQKTMALSGRRYLYRDWIVKKVVLWVIVND